MIEALYEIGKILPQGDFLEEFIEDIGEGHCFQTEKIGKRKVLLA